MMSSTSCCSLERSTRSACPMPLQSTLESSRRLVQYFSHHLLATSTTRTRC
ncbi:unnamed protein product [Durusdinium trenchii]|uniref:Uncharacterized protein n=2 Tax=Durusdinium trenchii TaxID=1381693 RepID=A0ABP0IFE5_9DINO